MAMHGSQHGFLSRVVAPKAGVEARRERVRLAARADRLPKLNVADLSVTYI